LIGKKWHVLAGGCMNLRNICSCSVHTSRDLSQDGACQRLSRIGPLQRFVRDESGNYVILSALLMPVLVGTAGLGTEVGWWYYKHKNMQSAADSGAASAAAAYVAGGDLTAEANAVTATYGYANAVNNVTITVNQPPTTGNYTSNLQAIEVTVSQPQQRLLSSLFGSDPVLITARAVALPNSGTGSVLALNSSASQAGNQLNLNKSNLYGATPARARRSMGAPPRSALGKTIGTARLIE
jgi:Flp pilus assembly protein TadG